MSVRHRSTLFIGLMLLLPTHVVAEIYEWVDEKNRKHYTQIPPEDKSKIIRVIGKSGNTKSTPDKSRAAQESVNSAKAYSDYLESERLERKEQRAEKKQQRAKLQKYCNGLRAELSDSQQGGVMYYELDENGERVLWSDERTQQEITRLQERIEVECGGAPK